MHIEYVNTLEEVINNKQKRGDALQEKYHAEIKKSHTLTITNEQNAKKIKLVQGELTRQKIDIQRFEIEKADLEE